MAQRKRRASARNDKLLALLAWPAPRAPIRCCCSQPSGYSAACPRSVGKSPQQPRHGGLLRGRQGDRNLLRAEPLLRAVRRPLSVGLDAPHPLAGHEVPHRCGAHFTEDARFRTHSVSINILRWRDGAENAFANTSQGGGSTITQQLLKPLSA